MKNATIIVAALLLIASFSTSIFKAGQKYALDNMPEPVVVEVPMVFYEPYRCMMDFRYVDPLSHEDADKILTEALDSHAYYVYIMPTDVAFHAMWVERYQQLIDLIDKYEEERQ